MSKFIILILCFFFFGCSLPVEEKVLRGELINISDSATITEIAESISPAVVGISGISDKGESVGSGVCVAEGGYIITNSHVVNGCNKIYIYLSNKSSAVASIIYEDTVLDLAIIKCNKSLPYLPLSDSDTLKVGEEILAVGTPLSLTLTHSFTKGIVSALDRTLKVSSISGEGYMQNLIQHDASLNPGNSGGPLINSSGEVVGINTLKISGGEGIGFAIPTKSFASLINSYAKNINYQLPYLGVYGYDSEIASYYGKTTLEDGFFVLDIAENSPLKMCDIKRNSIITKLNNVQIKNALDLRNELYKLSKGDAVYIEYFDGENFLKTKIKLNKI